MDTNRTTIGQDPRVVMPLYTIHEASSALDIPATTLSRWARTRPPQGVPNFVTRSPNVNPRQPCLPFIGLAEAYVLTAFRRAGVPLQRIRPALVILTEKIGLEHALASKRLFTDGAEILYDLPDLGDEDGFVRQSIHKLVIVRNGQQTFRDIIRGYLTQIQWGEDGYPLMLRLPSYTHAHIVVDPARAFGQPIFISGGVKVQDVLHRFWGGDDLISIAEDFDLPISEVEDVVRVISRHAS